MKSQNKHVGSSLEDFLTEEGILEETRAMAIKETVAWQVQQAMETEKITKVEMAKRMKTSRAALVFGPQLGIGADQHPVGGLSLAGMTRDRVAALP